MKRDLVVQAAVELGLEDGQKLRVDTTAVQTDIHHPTHNTLLWDVVRVVARLIGRLAKALERQRIKGFRDRTRSAQRRMQEIQRMTPRQRQDRQTRHTVSSSVLPRKPSTVHEQRSGKPAKRAAKI
jgi:IS5 family transposase